MKPTSLSNPPKEVRILLENLAVKVPKYFLHDLMNLTLVLYATALQANKISPCDEQIICKVLNALLDHLREDCEELEKFYDKALGIRPKSED